MIQGYQPASPSASLIASLLNGGALNNVTIGQTTAAAGAFTTLAASSTVSGTGFSTYLASPPAIGGTAAAAGSFTQLNSSTNLTAIGAGSSSAADSTAMPALFSAGASPTAGNLYGIAILKSGSEEAFFGINKNSSTTNVPANALYISTYTATGKISIGRGNGAGLPAKMDIGVTGAGSILVGTPSISASATDGFLYIPAGSGSPSGTPTSQSGYCPMYIDVTNNKFWFYTSAWKGVAIA